MPKESTVRLELNMPTSVNERLKALLEKSKAPDMGEVFRNTLAIYEALIDAKAKGDMVIVRSKDGEERELVVR